MAEDAARAGAAVVMEAVDKPRNIQFKGATDLVTDTDKAAEEACLAVVRAAYPDHAILGEEGGVSGDPSSGMTQMDYRNDHDVPKTLCNFKI